MAAVSEQETLIKDSSSTETPQGSHNLQTTVQGRAIAQVVNGINFAMGMAWTATIIAYVAPHLHSDDENPLHINGHRLSLLTWSGSLIIVFVVLMMISIKIIKSWQAKAKEAILVSDTTAAVKYHAKEMSLTTLVKWGLGSCVGNLVNAAVRVYLPVDWKASLAWLVVSIVINLILVLIIRCCLKAHGLDGDKLPVNKDDVETADDGFLRVGCDIWFSTGALISALAFLDFIEIWFLVNPALDRSTDVVALYIFSVVAVVVAGIFLAVLQNADRNDAIEAQQSGRAKVSLYFRKFLAKTLTLCAATIVYLLLYVSLIEMQFKLTTDKDVYSVYEILPLWSAGTLLASALVVNITVGLLIERSLKSIAKGLAAVPRDTIPGLVDDAVLATLQSIAQSTSASYIVAFGWLVGNAFHKFFVSAWQYFFADGNWMTSSLVYTLALTVLAIITSVCLPPAPKEV